MGKRKEKKCRMMNKEAKLDEVNVECRSNGTRPSLSSFEIDFVELCFLVRHSSFHWPLIGPAPCHFPNDFFSLTGKAPLPLRRTSLTATHGFFWTIFLN
jgi:hypothetical protein